MWICPTRGRAVDFATFPLDLAFFGLTLKVSALYRKNVYKEIHEICFHGKGGYDWPTVYNMPIWVRKFVFEEMREFYEEQNKETSSSNTTNVINSDGTINKPAFAEASKAYKSGDKVPKYK